MVMSLSEGARAGPPSPRGRRGPPGRGSREGHLRGPCPPYRADGGAAPPAGGGPSARHVGPGGPAGGDGPWRAGGEAGPAARRERVRGLRLLLKVAGRGDGTYARGGAGTPRPGCAGRAPAGRRRVSRAGSGPGPLRERGGRARGWGRRPGRWPRARPRRGCPEVRGSAEVSGVAAAPRGLRARRRG